MQTISMKYGPFDEEHYLYNIKQFHEALQSPPSRD